MKSSKAKPSANGAKRVDIASPMFGYKNPVGIDRRHGLIRTWTATNAACHAGAQLPGLLDKVFLDDLRAAGDGVPAIGGKMLRGRPRARRSTAVWPSGRTRGSPSPETGGG